MKKSKEERRKYRGVGRRKGGSARVRRRRGSTRE